MLQRESDQALGETQGDKTLSRGAGNLEHPGDFVLGVTGDEIKPAGTRGFVQTRFLVIGCGHRALPIRSPKIRHPPEDTVGPRLIEQGFAVARSIVTASDKSPNHHARRLPRRYTASAVLDHEGTMPL